MNVQVRPPPAFTVEHRRLGADRPRLKPKPDAAAQLLEVADAMQHLPRDCFRDPAELVTLMRRLAGRLIVIADTGLVSTPSHTARAPRQPFLRPQRVDAKTVADSVFGLASTTRTAPCTVTSRKGRTVRVEVRRKSASPNQLHLPI